MSKIITQKCKVEKCEGKGNMRNNKIYFTKGYCQKHYLRLLKYGNTSDESLKVIVNNKTKHPLYTTYRSMLHRCYYEKHCSYYKYNNMGIKVCDRWLGKYGFDNFLKDVGNKPSTKYTLDRRDNSKGYSPENCRWATIHQQANTTKNNDFVGVSYDNLKSKWRAYISINNKRYRKTFNSKNEAINYRENLENELLCQL